MNASKVEDEFSALESLYRSRYERVLFPLSARLDSHLRDVVRSYPRLDRVSVRAKAVDRFLEKAARREGGERKYGPAEPDPGSARGEGRHVLSLRR